jgi:hypothetical protein
MIDGPEEGEPDGLVTPEVIANLDVPIHLSNRVVHMSDRGNCQVSGQKPREHGAAYLVNSLFSPVHLLITLGMPSSR